MEVFTGDFEMIGKIIIGEMEQKTNNRFRNTADYESYINTIDISSYDSDDVVFTGWLNKSNTLEFKK